MCTYNFYLWVDISGMNMKRSNVGGGRGGGGVNKTTEKIVDKRCAWSIFVERGQTNYNFLKSEINYSNLNIYYQNSLSKMKYALNFIYNCWCPQQFSKFIIQYFTDFLI